MRGADWTGAWVVGYVVNLGVCNSMAAELWAVAYGLELAWSRGGSKCGARNRLGCGERNPYICVRGAIETWSVGGGLRCSRLESAR